MIIYIVLTFLAISLIYESYYINRNLIKYKIGCDNKKIHETEEVLNVIILLPVYKEKENIKALVNYLYTLNYSKLEIIVITTDRELETISYEESTYAYINKWVKEYKNLRCINSPNIKGGKATQLNYALEILRKEEYSGNDFVIIYDIDSRPDIETLKVMNYMYTSNPQINVFQQSSLYIANFNDLNAFFKTEALMQVRRSLGIEIPNYRYTKKYKGIPYLVPYCVGHGLAVRLKFLVENGGMPEPYEDIAFGRKMVLKKEYICPLEECFDRADVVSDFKAYFRQLGVWYLASCTGMKEIISSKCKVGHKIQVFLWSLLDILSWDYYLLIVIILLISKMFWGIVIVFLLTVMNSLIVLKCVGELLEKNGINIRFKMRLKYASLYMVRELVRGIAPVSAITKLMKGL